LPLEASPRTSSIDVIPAAFESARPDTIPDASRQTESETYNYALSVDVLGFLEPAQFRQNDQDIPQTLQCTVASFLHGGIQSFVKDIATIDGNDSGQTTSGLDTQSTDKLRLLWVHVPINNTKWVHVCSLIVA
jgi:hypothetical protein